MNEYNIGPYKMGATLGVGTFGKVKLAMHERTGQKVAIKVINKNKMQSMDMHEKIRRELNILQYLDHPHVMRLYELVDSPTDIFMVMEYVSGGELFDHIVQKSRLPENEARRFFQQIVSGVEYCHHHMVCHRDLKPENVLLDANMNVKVGDFGLSNFMREGEFLKTSCGSPNYASPEVVSGKAYAGPEVDVWSCGVILYALLCGSLPFDDEHVPNLFKKIKHGNFTLPGHLPENPRSLIVRMLVVDPAKRITIKEIRRHPWFKQSLPLYISLSYLRHPSSDTVDVAIVKEMRSLGYDVQPDEIEIHTPVGSFAKRETVAYHLLSQKRSKQNCYLAKEAPNVFSKEAQKKAAYLTSQESNGVFGNLDFPSMFSRPSSRHASPLQIQGNPIDYSPGNPAWTTSRWKLGIESMLDSASLVTTVLDTLKGLRYEWFMVTPYKIRCRPIRLGSPEDKNRYRSNSNIEGKTLTGSLPHLDLFSDLHTAADRTILNTRNPVLQPSPSSLPDSMASRSRSIPPEGIILTIQLYKIASSRYLIDVELFDGPAIGENDLIIILQLVWNAMRFSLQGLRSQLLLLKTVLLQIILGVMFLCNLYDFLMQTRENCMRAAFYTAHSSCCCVASLIIFLICCACKLLLSDVASISEALWVTSAIYSALAQIQYHQTPGGPMPIWSPTTPVMLKSTGPHHRIFG